MPSAPNHLNGATEMFGERHEAKFYGGPMSAAVGITAPRRDIPLITIALYAHTRNARKSGGDPPRPGKMAARIRARLKS